ncbi:MAG: esterase family protein [Acidobacteria bacterium]|nr:esterase family protein [Acidobacteriota bacterium]
MNRRIRDVKILFLLLLLPALISAPAACAQTAAPAPAAPSRVEAVAFESKLIGKPLAYNVVLPTDYAQTAAAKTRYSVLYLLHGLGGGARDWVSVRARLAEHAAQYRLIIVVPEGKDGWYTDSATVPMDKFETYFVEELIPDVQRRFRTNEARAGRAVAGLSMGGYGALKFGLKHPEKFALAASMSGAFSAASWKPEDPLPEFVRPSITRVFGPADSPTRPANDIYRLVREMTPARIPALPFFYLDCGTEDFLAADNRALSGLLMEKKIPHEYRQLPGNHSWPYWDQQVREILKLAERRLAAPASPSN